MCGICGVVDFNRPEAVSAEVLQRMNDTLAHRGPNDAGIHLAPHVGLGHRRLSIIDVAGGHQPLSNEDRTVWVLLNGEIYNYPELRERLLKRHHAFATCSDTEVIAHLYEDEGEACFAQLRGMFAIALWDAPERHLLLARDRVGKKPLFYSHQGAQVIFGSELKALLASQQINRAIDPHSISDYFSLGYVPAPKTIYRSVRKVLPGHYLLCSSQGVKEVQYWDLFFANPSQQTEEQWCELLRNHICEATRVRLMSEVPLGAFLSGGVDSSTVVAFMSRLMNRPVTTCSIAFEEEEYNEAPFARQIAGAFQTDHHEHTVKPRAVDVVNKLAWHYDEPFADSSAVPTYYVSSVARQHVTVALGGDGGDENFAGYRRYCRHQYSNRVRSFVPLYIRRPLFGALGRYYPALGWAPRFVRARNTFQSLAGSPLEGYFDLVSIFRTDEKRRLLSGDLRNSLNGYDTIEVLRQYYERSDGPDPLSRIQYLDIKTYLTDDILAKVDRASMAVSLEVRAPLLDHKLMELAARMPAGLKLRGTKGKYILKKALEPILPSNILYRHKQGFSIPLHQWFRHELKELAQEALFSTQDGVLEGAYVRKIWDQHQKGLSDRSAYLWAVLMFRTWQKTFAA